jgi:hypothetical protein
MSLDLTGRKYGRLTVTRLAGIKYKYQRVWECVCECGKTTLGLGGVLQRGDKKSCGCLASELSKKRITDRTLKGLAHTSYKHGHALGSGHSGTYNTWFNMKHRCYYKGDVNYKNYGGRGIVVCERWHSFENFLHDMGTRPEATSIDRIDVNGNYEPSNCRWSSHKEQCINKRPTKLSRLDASEIKFSKATSRELSEKFNVTIAMVNMIRGGHSWAHLAEVENA